MKRLEVRFTAEPGLERVVGQLAETAPRPAGHQVVFEYDPAFLRDPLWLSPFKLPPQSGLLEHRDLAFGPIFGLFDDSLPDGWGLLLMDRCCQQRGSALTEVSVLDRLAYLGTRTVGALRSEIWTTGLRSEAEPTTNTWDAALPSTFVERAPAPVMVRVLLIWIAPRVRLSGRPGGPRLAGNPEAPAALVTGGDRHLGSSPRAVCGAGFSLWARSASRGR